MTPSASGSPLATPCWNGLTGAVAGPVEHALEQRERLAGIERGSEVPEIEFGGGSIPLLAVGADLPLAGRSGRGLTLTDAGRFVFHYADDIFTTGIELAQQVRNETTALPASLGVGVVSSIPKLIAHRILRPALRR